MQKKYGVMLQFKWIGNGGEKNFTGDCDIAKYGDCDKQRSQEDIY